MTQENMVNKQLREPSLSRVAIIPHTAVQSHSPQRLPIINDTSLSTRLKPSFRGLTVLAMPTR